MSAPPGSDISHYPQPFVTQGSSEKTPIGRTPGETKDHLQSQLGAVENLQYQVTSQELQFAQRMALKEQQAAEHVKITVASTSSDSNDDGKVPDSLLESQGVVSRDTNTKDSAPVDNHVTGPSANQWTSSPVYDQPLFTSSSEGQASLQEIWKMLDEEESFQSPTPRKARPSSTQRLKATRDQDPDHLPARDSSEHDSFALKGRRTEVQSRPSKQRPELSKKAAGKVRLAPKKMTVRNYNIRDDG